MEVKKYLRVLGLSSKEEKVLLAVIGGYMTPLTISQETKVTWPAVYDILIKLKNRGLVHSRIHNGKKSWVLSQEEEISEVLYDAKKTLLSLSDGVEEVRGKGGGIIVVHRGREAIVNEFKKMFSSHKNERLFGFQGTQSFEDWEHIIGIETTIKLNELVKSNHLIIEAILPTKWYKNALERYGKEWVESYRDRSAATYEIDEEFFNHRGELFMFKDVLYLIAIKEEIIIEIRHSVMQDMFVSMIRAIEKSARKVDVNRELRNLVAG